MIATENTAGGQGGYVMLPVTTCGPLRRPRVTSRGEGRELREGTLLNGSTRQASVVRRLGPSHIHNRDSKATAGRAPQQQPWNSIHGFFHFVASRLPFLADLTRGSLARVYKSLSFANLSFTSRSVMGRRLSCLRVYMRTIIYSACLEYRSRVSDKLIARVE